MMDEMVKITGMVVLMLMFGAVMAMLTAFPVKWLWNWLMPTIFGLPTINAWQGWGLAVLAGMVLPRPSANKERSKP